jgi:hypothetical protein
MLDEARNFMLKRNSSDMLGEARNNSSEGIPALQSPSSMVKVEGNVCPPWAGLRTEVYKVALFAAGICVRCGCCVLLED